MWVFFVVDLLVVVVCLFCGLLIFCFGVGFFSLFFGVFLGEGWGVAE